MERKIFLQPGDQVTVIAGSRQPGKPLISEEERKAQAARRHALRQARDAARQLSLGLRPLQGRDPRPRYRRSSRPDTEVGEPYGRLARSLGGDLLGELDDQSFRTADIAEPI